MHFVLVDNPTAIEQVEQLARLIWSEHYTPIIGQAQVEYMLETLQSKNAIARQMAEGTGYYLLENESGHPVGYFAILPKAHELFLSKLYVAADYRRKGYGRQVLNYIVQKARLGHLGKITLTVNKRNTQSIYVYQKMGFVIQSALVADIGNGFQMDDYQMTLEVI